MTCKKCGYWEPICKCDERVFHTHRDKLYEFTEKFGGKEFEIRGKGQWKKFMKKHGLNDDIKQGVRDPRDFKKESAYKPVPRKELAACMMQEIKDKGLYDKFKFKRR